MNQPGSTMKRLIIAGTYAQYRDWLVLHKASMKAALYIHRPEQLRGFRPDEVVVELVGDFRDNPAYMSEEYIDFMFRRHDAGIDQHTAAV